MKTSKLQLVCIPVCIFLFCGHGSAPAADTNLPPRLSVELRDGSRVVGSAVGKSLKFHSELLGDLKLDVRDIRSIDCVATNTAKLTTANGDNLSVWFVDSELAVKTSFGKVDLAVNSIRRLAVSASGKSAPRHEGLVSFWSGDGNANDSVGGNNGTLSGNATFAAKSGRPFIFDGLNSCVKIPQSPNLNLANQVTISFWMKADVDNPANICQGLVTSDFYLIEIDNGPGERWGVNFVVSTTANSGGVRSIRRITPMFRKPTEVVLPSLRVNGITSPALTMARSSRFTLMASLGGIPCLKLA